MSITRKRIADIPKIQRPRERFVSLGRENLTNVELLAIILGSGTKNTNVISLARGILKKYPLTKLSNTPLTELINTHGIGEIQAIKILAGIELGLRSSRNSLTKMIKTPQDVYIETYDIREKSREHLVALYLNARYELIHKQTISIGGLNKIVIEPRDVFSEALKNPCAYIILVHNHPSNDTSASQDDISFTNRVIQAGNLLGISIIDHIIVGSKDYYSMKENGHI